ncbi:MAG: thioesterase [Rhodospirillaceae bacterium]|nr:thioesterase [Rhodospirillaceae bacterium]|tara:strand:- start:1983 stop:2405 length:423 start_codon:yes stop_codon:yes gene_type:complete
MDEGQARKKFEEAVASYSQEFGSFFIAKLMGLEISYQHDACLIHFPVLDFLFNPQGTYHGGMLATVMDISMGHLINHDSKKPGFTLEMKNQFLRPLTIGPASCKGQFLRRGRSISFLESKVWDANEKLVAHATSTWKMGE